MMTRRLLCLYHYAHSRVPTGWLSNTIQLFCLAGTIGLKIILARYFTGCAESRTLRRRRRSWNSNGSVEEEFQEQQANHHNRILLWIVMLPKSFVPRISNTRETELEMICEYSSRKCRWSRVLRGGANEAGRGVGRQRIVAEDFLGIRRDSLFVFNIKINESKQNNKSSEKLNCNDVVLPSSTSRSTRPTRRTLSRRRYIRGSVSTRWLPEGGRHRKRWLHVGSER